MFDPRPFRTALVLLSLSALASSQTVWTVDDDGGPGVDFTDIQAAIDVAGEGDVVLIRAGDYTPIVIDGKALTLQAEGNGVRLSNNVGGVSGITTVEIRDLGPGQEVFLRGLWIGATYYYPAACCPAESVRIIRCDGAVWLEELRIAETGSFLSVHEGVEIHDAAGVTLTRCTIDVKQTFLQSIGPGSSFFGDAVQTSNSNVAMFDCVVNGGDSSTFRKARGGHGVVLDGGTFYASGCTFRGGNGSDGTPTLPDGDDGGDGLVEASPVRAGVEDFVETFTGLDLNLFGDFMGTMGPSGTLVVSTPSGALPAGIDMATITTQASYLDVGGAGFFFSAPSVITLVGAGF